MKAEKEDGKPGGSSSITSHPVYIFEKSPLRKMPSSKEIQTTINLGVRGDLKQESESHAA